MLDIILLVVFIFIFYWGYKRGFIKIFRRVFGVFASYLAAYFAYRPVSDWLMTTTLKDRVYQILAQKSTVNEMGISIDIKPKLLAEPFEKAINNGIHSVADNVLMAATGLVMNAIAAILVFVLVFLVVKMIWGLLEKISKLPVINGVNKIAGMAIGAASGLVCVYLAGLLLLSLSETNPKLELWITGSYILEWIF